MSATSCVATLPSCYNDWIHPIRPRESLRVSDTSDPSAEFEKTVELLRKARGGDDDALEVLLKRHVPRLRRWARGRLPRWARDAVDTEDIVQDTVMRTLRRLGEFEPRHDGALQAYLRQALLNRVQDEIRRAQRRPGKAELDEEQADGGASPLEEAVGRQALERYETALARLREDDRAAVLMRVELRCGYQEIAEALGKPSADAARMTVARALVRLVEEMGDGRQQQ